MIGLTGQIGLGQTLKLLQLYITKALTTTKLGTLGKSLGNPVSS